MKYAGIDLHKQNIVICVVDQERKVLARKHLPCKNEAEITEWFKQLGDFQFVVEATATYEWFVQLIGPLAKSWVLANPSRMRVIAESTKKTDNLDARLLAEFLALGMIPKAYRPKPREREHRVLVRYRMRCRQRISKLKCQIRHLAATYNLDHADLFEPQHLEAFRKRPELTRADKFVIEQRLLDYDHACQQLKTAQKELKNFMKEGSEAEQKQRDILLSVPGVGEVVAEVVLAELGEVERFSSIKDATAYGGLVPATRQSDGKGKDLGITKCGSRLLRWAMVEAAWQAVRHSARWAGVYENLKRRRGAKRAIVAVARRLLGMLTSMLKSGSKYRYSIAELKEREAKAEKRKEKAKAKRQAAAIS
jgi:transposase